MVKVVLILLSILIAANAVRTKSGVSRNGFNYVGSFRPRSSVQSRSFQPYDESNYYMSQNWGAWNSADKDCKELIGDNATLVAIESNEEWNFLKKILQDYGFAHDYWTSGLWDASSSRWRWLASHAQLEQFAPWAAGHPNNPNSLLRVVINYRNAFDASWRTVSYTQLHRYICEVKVHSGAIAPAIPPTMAPTMAPAIPPTMAPTTQNSYIELFYKMNDLVIVLDMGSIGFDNFHTALELVERLARAFTIDSENRLSFITKSHSGQIHIDLNNTMTTREISSTILSTKFQGGKTDAAIGIEFGMRQLQSNNPLGRPMYMVVIIDGAFNSLDSMNAAAQRANIAGIPTFAVCISCINQHELLGIAMDDPNRVFTLSNVDILITWLASL